MVRKRINLIITCKGFIKKGQYQKCEFIYDGNWGDLQLIEHQKYHDQKSDAEFWLGFTSPPPIGKLSGRDGKEQ